MFSWRLSLWRCRSLASSSAQRANLRGANVCVVPLCSEDDDPGGVEAILKLVEWPFEAGFGAPEFLACSDSQGP